jgi:hypothetical protein
MGAPSRAAGGLEPARVPRASSPKPSVPRGYWSNSRRSAVGSCSARRPYVWASASGHQRHRGGTFPGSRRRFRDARRRSPGPGMPGRGENRARSALCVPFMGEGAPLVITKPASIPATNRRWRPCSIHGFTLGPVQAQHEYELAIGGGEPVGLLMNSGRLVLNVQVC